MLVTAISPTPAGEGKTTTTIGLGDALNLSGRRTVICLREPSLGPCFGMKGGANGGGRAQVVPQDEINLHLTGDFHAITAATNLLAAMIDNHVYWGNALGIDPSRVSWRRALDINDRALREIVVGLGSGGPTTAPCARTASTSPSRPRPWRPSASRPTSRTSRPGSAAWWSARPSRATTSGPRPWAPPAP